MTGRFARVLIVTAALSLSACAVIDDVQQKYFNTNKVNLTDSTYAAADMLAQQTKTHMTPSTPLHTMVITDVNHPDETTAFGAQLANQLGSRFVQLGYNVQGTPMSPSSITSTPVGSPVALTPTDGAPHPSINGSSPGKAIRGGDCTINGNYTRLKNSVLVSLRIMQGTDQHVIAAYDYTLPLNGEIDDLSMSATEKQKRQAEPLISLPGSNN